MPELPEVETVKETLKRRLISKKINNINIFYDNIIEYPNINDFKNNIKNQMINDITRRGKWLIFVLDDYFLLSHLRMEGKYFIKDKNSPNLMHEHVEIYFDDNTKLVYKDVRKFGKMYLIEKDNINKIGPLSELGLEPWDCNLTISYLYSKFYNKSLPIKTMLLDQTIIAGIGNIYADEILFLSGINPLKKAKELEDNELDLIIKNTRDVLKKAIEKGGTTIRTYSSVDGVHGLFQRELLVHGREGEPCCKCKENINKIKVGGRGTYYCPTCQK